MKRPWKIGITVSSALAVLGLILFIGYYAKLYLVDIPKELLEQAEKVDITYIKREMPLSDLIQMPSVEGNAAQDYIKALKFGYGDTKIQLRVMGKWAEIYDTEANILDYILAGAQKTDCDFATIEYQTAEGIINFPTPTFALNPLVRSPNFVSAIRLARALAAKGDRYFVLGEVQKAQRVYESILVFGHHLESCRQTISQFMTGVAISTLGSDRLERFYSYEENTERAAKAKEYKAQSGERMKGKLSQKTSLFRGSNYEAWIRILKEDEDAMFRRRAAQRLSVVFAPAQFHQLFGRRKVSKALEDAMQNDEDQSVRETAQNILYLVKNKQERGAPSTKTPQLDLSKILEKRAENGTIQKNDFQTWLNKGLGYYHKKRFNEAIDAYKQAINLQPDHSETHYHLGRVYYAEGMLEKARNEYELALELDPGSLYTFAVYNGLGELHASEEMYSEAITEFRKSIALKPEYITAHVNLAEAYSAKGLYNEAISELKLAAYINGYGTALDIYYDLARLYSLKNDKSQAMEALEKAIAGYFGKKYIQKAKDDEDFDNIRGTPEFQAMLSERTSPDYRRRKEDRAK